MIRARSGPIVAGLAVSGRPLINPLTAALEQLQGTTSESAAYGCQNNILFSFAKFHWPCSPVVKTE